MTERSRKPRAQASSPKTVNQAPVETPEGDKGSAGSQKKTTTEVRVAMITLYGTIITAFLTLLGVVLQPVVNHYVSTKQNNAQSMSMVTATLPPEIPTASSTATMAPTITPTVTPTFTSTVTVTPAPPLATAETIPAQSNQDPRIAAWEANLPAGFLSNQQWIADYQFSDESQVPKEPAGYGIENGQFAINVADYGYNSFTWSLENVKQIELNQYTVVVDVSSPLDKTKILAQGIRFDTYHAFDVHADQICRFTKFAEKTKDIWEWGVEKVGPLPASYPTRQSHTLMVRVVYSDQSDAYVVTGYVDGVACLVDELREIAAVVGITGKSLQLGEKILFDNLAVFRRK